MKNNISIDDLVRQGIAKGEEPHNLGAWANMERMLDGNNPYQVKEEDSKKRPWLFMLLGLVVCSTAVMGGYNYFSGINNAESNQVAIAKHSNNHLNTQASPAFDKENTIVENLQENNSIESNITNKSQQSIVNNNTPIISNNRNVAKQNAINSGVSNLRKSKVLAPVDQTKSDYKTALSPKNNKEQNNKSKNRSAALTLASNIKQTKAAPTNNTTNENLAKTINNSKIAAKASTVANNDNINLPIEPTIVESYMDTMNATKITQRIVRDEYGNKKYVTDSSKFKIIEEKQRVVVNPRYVELTAEQEKAAQRKTALASNSDKIDAPSMQAMNAEMQVAPKATLSIKENTETSKSKSKKGFFSRFSNIGQKTKQKAINMAHTPIPIYTGMFVGVNAAFNSKHNFGGFQGGFTAMTPLSRLLSLQTEARFIHKNNSGYTVTDNRSTIMNTIVDSTSWTHGKIYNYEIDSVTTGYNLKSFYNIQVPVLLNLHLNKFNAYAGVQLNYGLRMNTTASQNENPLYISDTVTSATSYVKRTNTSPKFTRDDFGSRFGLGYTVGGSYNINPNLYFDLRMSNLFWDNTKGEAKQEISDVFYKMPSFQLSLGYRFRKFETERR